MATSRGGADVRRFMAQLPGQLEQKVLRGAARAAGAVVLNEAKDRVTSDEVRGALIMNTKAAPGQIVATITVAPGFARSIGTWLEWGTAPHFITVDQGDRRGRSVSRINKQAKDGSLAIGGQFVGPSVFHPGARPHPFLRVALDTKASAAIAAAQSYINSRITPAGITGNDEPDSEAA